MTPEQILTNPANVLTREQREFYFRHGYVVIPGAVNCEWLERLREVTERKIDESRQVTQSGDVFDLGPGHCAAAPHVRRIRATVDQDPAYWEFVADSTMTDIAADLVGPDVKFHSSKLNIKRSGGGEAIRWHQDIQFWPHTNYSPMTLGVYLHDVGLEQGPLSVIPDSHEGPLFDQYEGDTWVGYITDADLTQVNLDSAVDLTGAAGTAVIVNCRTIHGSRENRSSTDRPLFLNIYCSADAFPYTAMPTPNSHTGEIVRGKPARWAHLDARPCLIPPPWDKVGYGSIFTVQKKEQFAQAAD